jgi:hypothetical protein
MASQAPSGEKRWTWLKGPALDLAAAERLAAGRRGCARASPESLWATPGIDGSGPTGEGSRDQFHQNGIRLRRPRDRTTVHSHTSGMDSVMRIPTILMLLALVACAVPDGKPHADAPKDPRSGEASQNSAARPAAVVSAGAKQVGLAPDNDQVLGLFAGHWEACNDATSPEECSRYHLLQQADRVCGTWYYVASGDLYEGRVIAKTSSATEARRIRVCGRAGSEAQTSCNDGWDVIDKPLRLCDGRLGDMEGEAGTCFADFKRAPDAADWRRVLMKQPWMKACLAGTHTEMSDDQPNPPDAR